MTTKAFIEKLLASGGDVRSTCWGELEGYMSAEEILNDLRNARDHQFGPDLWTDLGLLLDFLRKEGIIKDAS